MSDPIFLVLPTENDAERRRLRWFSGGLMCGLLAEQTILFAVPLIIYETTKNVAYSGTAFALEWLPALIAYPFAGLLVDLVGGRFLFLRANIVRAGSLLITLLICWLAPSLTVVALIVNGVMLSALMAPIRMAVEKTVPALASGDNLSRTQSLVQNVELLAMAVGPGIAAALAALLGKLFLLGLAAIAFIAASWCWKSLPTTKRQAVSPKRVGHDLLLGWKLLLNNRAVICLAMLNCLINLGLAVALSSNAFLITGTFGASDTVFGMMNAGAGALGLFNLLFMPRLLASWSIFRVGAAGFAMLCVSMTCIGLAANVGVYVFSFLGFMAGDALYNVFNRTQRIKAIDPEHLGKVIGPFYLINCLSYPLGGVIAAGLGRSVGIQNILLFLALLLAFVGGPLLWTTARYFRRQLNARTSTRPNGGADEVVAADSSPL